MCVCTAPRWSRSRQLDRPLRTSSTENERSMMGNAKLDACREYNQRITNAMEDRSECRRNGSALLIKDKEAASLSSGDSAERTRKLPQSKNRLGSNAHSISTAALGHRGPPNKMP